MDTVRSVSASNPGSNVPAETAAALAAASMVFRKVDRKYSKLLATAKKVMQLSEYDLTNCIECKENGLMELIEPLELTKCGWFLQKEHDLDARLVKTGLTDIVNTTRRKDSGI